MKINKQSFAVSLATHIQKLLLFQRAGSEQSYEDTVNKLLLRKGAPSWGI